MTTFAVLRTDVTLPPWWHPEVPADWHLPESGDFPREEDEALREEEST